MKLSNLILGLTLLFLSSQFTHAQLKSDAKKIGSGGKKVGIAVGKGGASVGKAIAKSAKTGNVKGLGKSVGKTSATTGKSVGKTSAKTAKSL